MDLPENIEMVDGKVHVEKVECCEHENEEGFCRHIYKGLVVEKGSKAETIKVGDIVYFNSDYNVNQVLYKGCMVIDYLDILYRDK